MKNKLQIKTSISIILCLFIFTSFSQKKVQVLYSNADNNILLRDTTISFDNKKTETTIKLNKNKQFQTIDGFGAAITGSSSYNLLKMSAENRKSFLEKTFSEKRGYGFSYVRVAIGCSDFSLSEYTCCEKIGIENFGLTDEETIYVIPILKEILKINPYVKIMAAPWTAPRWMKVKEKESSELYNSWTGGHVASKYYQDYATYFVKWIKAFNDNGIPIYAITPQNEPLNAGNSASTLMYWDEQRDFIKNALGPQFKKEGIKTKIYIFDHNYNYDGIASQNDYPLRIYEDKIAASYISGATYHNYNGNLSELNDIHNKIPDKEIIFTETSIGTWNDGLNLKARLIDEMNETALGTINNWCKGVIVWNLMLDNEKGPNREGGCQTCYGTVDIDKSDYKTITINSHYVIIAHLSAFIKPNAVRIEIVNEGNIKGIINCAFLNSDGTYSLILSNNSKEQKNITINEGKKSFSYLCPANSILSFSWKY